MSAPAIKVENLSKQYRIGKREGYITFREAIVSLSRRLFIRWSKRYSQSGSSTPTLEMIWALKDVSFEIKPGEVVGIIGKNGAGKSTLLKILSKITEPTEGKIELRGRVGSLLEIGTGFHPELTGHENIYLYGAILGMDRWEVTRKFDEIVAFAELEKFIDTPVKRYSSGMYMRLAFAVAAHLETEILLLDEVLAVGDMAFQKKCLGKMGDVSAEGKTVLFVSHNMGAIRKLCSKGIYLDAGRIMRHGKATEVVTDYERSGSDTAENYWINENETEKKRVAFIDRIEVLGGDKKNKSVYLSSENIAIKFFVTVKEANPGFKLGFDLMRNSEVVFRSQQVDSPKKVKSIPVGRNELTCEIPPNLLNEGEYLIVPQFSIHLIKGLITNPKPVLKFSVKLDTSRSEFHFVLSERNHPGSIFPLLNWELK